MYSYLCKIKFLPIVHIWDFFEITDSNLVNYIG
jgi:hypothetical protein